MGLCTSKANRFEHTKRRSKPKMRKKISISCIYELNDDNDLFPAHICHFDDDDDDSDLDIGKGMIHTANPFLFHPKTIQKQQPTHKPSIHTVPDYRTRLVQAYIYDIRSGFDHHDIYQIILKYYPIYQIYGIDHNLINFTKNEQIPSTFQRLKCIENILSHSHCLYPSNNNNEYLIQNGNQIYQMSLLYDYHTAKYQVALQKESKTRNVGFISTGKHETFIKYQNGSIYSSGKVHSSSIPNKISIFGQDLYKMSNIWNDTEKVNIIQIECGLQHTLLLSDKGRVYSMGNNDKGECGLGGLMVNRFINKPTLIRKFVDMNYSINSISCHGNSSCCIDGIRQYLWCWGDTTAYLQSGDGINSYYSQPNIYLFNTLNNGDIHVIKAKCSHNATVVLDHNGYCYILGEMMRTRSKLNTNIKFKDFDIGYDQIILISTDDKIYSFRQIEKQKALNNNYNNHNNPYYDISKLENKLFPNLKPNSIVHSVSIAANSTIIIFS